VIIDVDVHLNKRRSCVAETSCYRREINPQSSSEISWFKVTHPKVQARYRMAAKDTINRYSSTGGSNNPYN
ncbi:MAG: hypothetical protein ACI9VT_002901, partial [Psychroserpens sp.]